MDLETFIAHMGQAIDAHPREAEKALRRGARIMVDALKAASPDSGKEDKHKLKDSWRYEMAGTSSASLQANIRSTSPHFHLVEQGHVQKTRTGKVVGYVQGTHFMERTANEKGDDILDDVAERLYKAVDGTL